LVAERFQKFRVQLLGSTNTRKQNVEAKHTSCNIKTFYLKKTEDQKDEEEEEEEAR